MLKRQIELEVETDIDVECIACGSHRIVSSLTSDVWNLCPGCGYFGIKFRCRKLSG
jgi:predicted RNA-binding Zn-ribbon protein involved in translation (DUF1610 family)